MSSFGDYPKIDTRRDSCAGSPAYGNCTHCSAPREELKKGVVACPKGCETTDASPPLQM